jgi:2-oxoglutarate/2-oxoacid ferredoxin oxidoreductase subunit alpha
VESLPPVDHNQTHAGDDPTNFKVYRRDEATLARRWAVPGIPGFEHRIGGLEKDQLTGNVSYDADNHELMIHTRARKVANIANFIPEQKVHGSPRGKLLVLGWGSPFGAIRAAVDQCRARGLDVSHAHLRYLNPFPKNLGEILNNFETVLVPELNLGQLSFLIQGRYLRQVVSMTKVKGRPFLVHEITGKIEELLK